MRVWVKLGGQCAKPVQLALDDVELLRIDEETTALADVSADNLASSRCATCLRDFAAMLDAILEARRIVSCVAVCRTAAVFYWSDWPRYTARAYQLVSRSVCVVSLAM